MLKLQFKCQKYWSVILVVFGIALAMDSSAHAQVTRRSQNPVPIQAMPPPDSSDIEATRTLVHRYQMESYLYTPNRQPFFVDQDNFASVLWLVLNYFDELISDGNASAIKEEDISTIQRLRTRYAAEFTSMRARLDYGEAAMSQKKHSLFGGTLGGSEKTLSLPDLALLFTKSPCFHPTFLQPDSIDVQLLRSLAKKYDVVLHPAKGSTVSAIWGNRSISRHEFAAALDQVLVEVIEKFKTDPNLILGRDKAILQRLYDDYAIELTSKVLLGVNTKLYTYCLN